ncbi:MAG: CAP domain-containing protein [Myxococcales bacterium]|nr:CAP domain-containing protein [Myxococcales bacterium]
MSLRRALGPVLLAIAACGGASSSGPGAASSGGAAGGAGAGGEVVEEKVVYEKLPDGRIKKTTIRTTRRTVPAEPPPPRPADPYPADPLVRYNVERINAYRAQHKLGPVLYDAKISAFATAGSTRLAADHVPHAHFREHAQGAPGFGSRSAENQGDPTGVYPMDADRTKNGQKQIDVMLKLMMDEGPGGGHYDNMMNPKFRRVGIGLVYVGPRLYMTNDFSD